MIARPPVAFASIWTIPFSNKGNLIYLSHCGEYPARDGPVLPTCLSAIEEIHRAALFVKARIKPVSLAEGVVVRRVEVGQGLWVAVRRELAGQGRKEGTLEAVADAEDLSICIHVHRRVRIANNPVYGHSRASIRISQSRLLLAQESLPEPDLRSTIQEQVSMGAGIKLDPGE